MSESLIAVKVTQLDASVASFGQQVAPVVQWAQSVVVTCESEAQAVALETRRIERMRKSIKEHFDPEVQGLHEAHKNLLGKVKALTDPLEQAKRTAGAKVLAWQAEASRAAEVAAMMARAEAEKKAAAEREALAEMAEAKADLGDEKGAMQLTFDAATVKVIVEATAPSPRIHGLYSRPVPRVTITDPALVPRQYCEPSESLLKLAWRLANYDPKFTVPGVTLSMDATPVQRS